MATEAQLQQDLTSAMKARTMEELVDQIVGRVLDQIGLHTDLPNRWRGTA